ncbi:hypothetical protein ABS71_17835 [bacterium SCN 62-11]|nr:MAG: hypothetical protein ABS71_17835 [bacterium SCN 62-11]
MLVMLPDDFMWPEYALPRALYEKAGFQVVVAGKEARERQPDWRYAKQFPDENAVLPNLTFDQVVVAEYAAVTFVGGNGAWHDFFPNPAAHRVLRQALAGPRPVGLICASTGLLALADNFDGQKPLARGKRVVGYFRVAGMLRQLGQVDYVEGGEKEPGVAQDGLLVTGRNPESSQLFGERMVQVLMGH